MKIGRIPYINCYPVYGAIDRGVVKLDVIFSRRQLPAGNIIASINQLDQAIPRVVGRRK